MNSVQSGNGKRNKSGGKDHEFCFRPVDVEMPRDT